MLKRPGSLLMAQKKSSLSLLMDTPVLLRSIKDIVDRYDVVLLDQFGVLHDGVKPLPGVVEALELLQSGKKTTVILSNSSNRKELAEKSFVKRLGLPLYHKDFITSGQMAWHYLEKEYKGKQCTWMTWGSYDKDQYLASLGIGISSIETADFLFLHGTHTMVSKHNDQLVAASLPYYKTNELCATLMRTLNIALERKIPAICANIDLSAVAGGKLSYMPGGIMEVYKAMGGEVVAFGKPNRSFFETAIRQAYSLSPDVPIDRSLLRRVVHVGDSLHHDIKGASDMGIDSILITGHGVHRDQLNFDEETNRDEKGRKTNLISRVCDLCDEKELSRPTYIMKSFAV